MIDEIIENSDDLDIDISVSDASSAVFNKRKNEQKSSKAVARQSGNKL